VRGERLMRGVFLAYLTLIVLVLVVYGVIGALRL
jgi:hypothetical protein